LAFGLFTKCECEIVNNDPKGFDKEHVFPSDIYIGDTIAYVTIDLEDAYKKNLFTLNDFIEFFESRNNGNSSGIKGQKSQEYYTKDLFSNLAKRLHAAVCYYRRPLIYQKYEM